MRMQKENDAKEDQGEASWITGNKFILRVVCMSFSLESFLCKCSTLHLEMRRTLSNSPWPTAAQY